MEVDRRRTRRWATALARRDDPALAAAGRTVLSLLDAAENGGAPDPERLARIRTRARAATGARDPDLRAAGRRVLELVDELEGRKAIVVPAAEAAAAPNLERPPRERAPRRRASVPRGRAAYVIAALVVAAALVAGAIAIAVARAVFAPTLDGTGPSGQLLGRATLARAVFRVDGDAADLREQSWTLDGRDVTSQVQADGTQLVYRPARLADGAHEVAVKRGRNALGLSATRSFSFRVDTTPPPIRIDGATAARAWEPLRLAGSAPGATAFTVDGRPAALDGDRFVLRRTPPVPSALVLAAVDEAGNRASKRVKIELVPRRPAVPVRAVHVTFYAWADKTLRAGVMQLINERRINAVELDLKDESGVVGFDAPIPFGRRIGSVQAVYDLPEAIDMLHRRGAMVVGRIVAFRDPVHATAAWKRGWRSQVIQTPSGEPYAGYGGFTNFSNPTVRRYNVDVARVAAAAGIDDVLYDYVRRPDGPIDSMEFPNLRGSPEQSIATFLAEARTALKPYGTFLGASVFGVAATRPIEVAQDIPAMARNVDYISPMLYPSHWGPGEYGVSYPNAEPYAIVEKSLRDFQRQVRGTGARVVPWLQDFSLGVPYGPAEVRAQIEAAMDVGIGEWLLWDPLVTYTADALREGRRLGPIPTRRTEVKAVATDANAKPSVPPVDEATAKAAVVRANELGEVPVLMYHQIRADGGGDYDLTADEFRAELERLWREGYRPVRAIDLVTGQLDVPAGKSPVVLTFDDSTKEQLALDRAGQIKPDTAIGIMLDFKRTHPGFELAGTFYPNREPFAGVAEGPRLLHWLYEHGFELGNHTKDHIPLNQLTGEEARRQLVLGRNVITDAVPDANVRTLALPLGAWPTPPSIAWRGTWSRQRYAHDGIFLVGAEPAKSPFARAFERHAIPRIRTTPEGASDPEYGSSWWLDHLRRDSGRRYVSDGDPDTIAFPRRFSDALAPRFRTRARPY